MDQYAICCPIVHRVCNFTNREKSRKISAPVAKQDFNLISKKKFFDMLVIYAFLRQSNGNTAYKVWLFFFFSGL